MSDRDSLRQLLTPLGQQALEAAARLAPQEAEFLAVAQRLERVYPPGLARAAVEQAILRRRAAAKFPAAGRMYFTREALEQASSAAVAGHRAGRFAGLRRVFDLGCGIGGDALALAGQAPVVAVDRDPLRLALLAANADVLGLGGRLQPVQADVRRPGWRFPPESGGFFDPTRRHHGRRVRSPEDYEPPLTTALAWLPGLVGLAVKVSPAVPAEALRGLDCEVEFVSLDGELKEATLWFGGFKTAGRRATLLPGPHTLVAERDLELRAGPPRAIIYEPDPAVMRAGLVRPLGAWLGADQLDPSIAYLTADRLTPTPFARAYRLIEAMPFSLKRLREALRARGVGQVTLKKRGSAVDVEDLAHRLRLRGEAAAVVILTRVQGLPVALIVEPVSPGG